jgi:hypothetical protein
MAKAKRDLLPDNYLMFIAMDFSKGDQPLDKAIANALLLYQKYLQGEYDIPERTLKLMKSFDEFVELKKKKPQSEDQGSPN